MRIPFLAQMLLLLMLILLSAQTELFVKGKLKCDKEFTFRIGLIEFDDRENLRESFHIISESEYQTSVNTTAKFATSGNTTKPNDELEQKVALVVMHSCNPYNYKHQAARKFLNDVSFKEGEIKKINMTWDLETAKWEDDGW
ncbi:unnamed protein product [Caenorhabditis nigoni]